MNDFKDFLKDQLAMMKLFGAAVGNVKLTFDDYTVEFKVTLKGTV